MASQSIKDTKAQLIASLAPNKSGWESLLRALGHLYTQGVAIDWAEYDKPYNRQKVLLPTYPFQRERYWIKTSSQRKQLGQSINHGLLTSKLSSASQDKVYQSLLSLDTSEYLKDHQVFDHVIFPGAGFVELMFASLSDQDLALSLSDISLDCALKLDEERDAEVQVIRSSGKRSRTSGCL